MLRLNRVWIENINRKNCSSTGLSPLPFFPNLYGATIYAFLILAITEDASRTEDIQAICKYNSK